MDPVVRPVLGYATGRLTDVVDYVPLGSGLVHGVGGLIRRIVLSGVGATGPFLVTVVVLGILLDFVSGALTPFVTVLDLVGVTAGVGDPLSRVVALLVIAGIVLVTGLLSEASPGTGIAGRAEHVVEGIPGVGSVYTSFDRMGDVLLDGDGDSFQEVKLVEFPQADTYALAFVTAEGPATVSAATGEDEMQVLFVPMAPNPVMGGYMVCVPTDRVIDVSMTVQEAFQAIITSGVAAGDTPPD